MDSLAETVETCCVTVDLTNVFDYAAGGSRLVVEGERVYKAGHLLIVGVEEIHQDGVRIFSTCLQSSSPSSEPHTIRIRTRCSFPEWSFQCSCKAGMGKCKHVMAVLYYLLKTPTVALLTVTDVKQKWGKIAAKTASDMYKTTRIRDLCYCRRWFGGDSSEKYLDNSVLNDSVFEDSNLNAKQHQSVMTNETEAARILCFLTEAFPESSLYYEILGRTSVHSTMENENQQQKEIVDDFLLQEICDRKLSSMSLCSLISHLYPRIFGASVKPAIFRTRRKFFTKRFIEPLELGRTNPNSVVHFIRKAEPCWGEAVSQTMTITSNSDTP
ncbi:uncharacterized protein LOC134222876 [Armigeres subalbatus]|uniref:uncharacterized protein LOC134222876 n=1 Tax=Armigeres subalbatus TaxID=124917 RepID=UPI002ED2D203